jgi:hypothetical protein
MIAYAPLLLLRDARKAAKYRAGRALPTNCISGAVSYQDLSRKQPPLVSRSNAHVQGRSPTIHPGCSWAVDHGQVGVQVQKQTGQGANQLHRPYTYAQLCRHCSPSPQARLRREQTHSLQIK